MASLTELFNPTFLMFLGILLLAIAVLVLYFESKFRDQNHKISSMLSLVSSLAEEMNTNKMMINHLTMIGAGNNGISQNITTPHENKNLEEIKSSELINVSDDEDDNESDHEDDNESDYDYDDSDDESSTKYNLEENNVIQISEPDVKVFKINISENNEDLEENLDNNSDNMDILDDLDDLDDLASCNSESSEDNIEESNLENLLPLDNDNNEELEKHLVASIDFKSINISTLEDSKENIDFKKLSLNKLRNIVSEKGLSIDASKLKKNELLKLLGVE